MASHAASAANVILAVLALVLAGPLALCGGCFAVIGVLSGLNRPEDLPFALLGVAVLGAAGFLVVWAIQLLKRR